MVSKILIVGFGSIGKRHLGIARSILPGSDIRILSRRDHPRTPDGANGFFIKLEEALQFRPDLSIICNPAPFHIPISLVLARQGSHLLIEKPLSDSCSGLSEFIETCEVSGVVAMTGYNLRFSPTLKSFRELIKTKSFGPVLSVRIEVGQFLPNWRPNTEYRESVSARKELGGGVLFELSHELDYLRWIFGEVIWVQATLCKQGKLDIDVEDTAHMTLGLATENSETTLVASVNLDFIRQDTIRTCTAICESGSYRWDGVAGLVSQFDPKIGKWKDVCQHTPKRDDSYRSEWKHLLECINNSSRPLASLEDGMKVLRIIEAIRSSSIKGSLIKIKRLPE